MSYWLSIRTPITAAALVLPLVVAGPANAASWSNVLSVGAVMSQACKTPIDGGRAWLVKVRLINGEDARYRATYTVTGAGDRVIDRVRLVAGAGTTSPVKKFLVRADGSQLLGASLATAGGAVGDSDVFRRVGRC